MGFEDRAVEDIDQLTAKDLETWFKYKGVPVNLELCKMLLEHIKPYLKPNN